MGAAIVVGVEGSERSRAALAVAMRLARVMEARLLLVNAYPFDAAAGGVARPEYEAFVRRESEALLDAHARSVRDVPVAVESVPTFSPARALHTVAERTSAALIVIGPTHRAVEGRTASGSVADRLLSGSPCPVVMAPARRAEETSGPWRRIGVAYVNTPAGHGALAVGAALAAASGAGLELIAVADPALVVADARAGRATSAELTAAQRAVLQRAVEAAVVGLPPGVEAHPRVLCGTPAEVLVTAGDDLDLLVCGSRDYGPATTVLVGGVSKQVARAASCPVMVVPRTPEVAAGALAADSLATWP